MKDADAKPLVSLCMPAYNYGHFIEEAVRSAWAQDYRPVELIVVDDGSTDNTWELLGRLKSDSPVPMTVVKGAHRGVSAALNVALEQAKGEWISILHADDFYRPDKVSRMMACTSDPRVTLVHSEFVNVDLHGNVTQYSSQHDGPPASGDALRDILLLKADVRSVTLLIRAETLRSVGGYDEACATEDWQVILRMAKAGLIAHVDEPLVYRRVHGENLSFSSFRDQRFSFNEVALHVLREVIPPDMDAEAICALHAASGIRNAVGKGAFEKAARALALCWDEFPNNRPTLVKELFRGVRSLLWLRALRPYLPSAVVASLLQLKVALKRRGVQV